jgi:hypothetical protein
MSDKASTEPSVELPKELQKEAVDALAQLPDDERRETFDYFKSLVNFNKHAAAQPSGS